MSIYCWDTTLALEPAWTETTLANWLDRNIPHPDIPQSVSSLFIYNAIIYLIEKRGFTIKQLARRKFRLAKALEGKIDQYRQKHRAGAYNALLFGPQSAAVEVSPALCFTYDEGRYAPNGLYDGNYRFQKHHFRTIGELKSEGEEFECAAFIDRLKEVKSWVRNLEKRQSSFSLPTSTDRFYPDFVAKLHDGRYLVVEYKGEDRWSNDDSNPDYA